MLLNDVKSKSLMLFGMFSEDLEKRLAEMEIEDDHFTVNMCLLVGGSDERLGFALGIRDEKINEAEDLRDDLRKLLLLAPDDTAKNYVEVQLRTIESKIKFMCSFIKSATYWIKNRYADVQDMLDEISCTDLMYKDNSKDKSKIKAKVKDLLPIKDIITVTVFLPCGEKMKFALLGKPLEDEVSDGLTAPALEVNDKVRWNGVKLYTPVYLLKWNTGDRIDNPTEIIPSGETWVYGDLGWRGEK